MKKHYRRKNKKAMRRKFKKKYKEIRNPVEYLKNKTCRNSGRKEKKQKRSNYYKVVYKIAQD